MSVVENLKSFLAFILNNIILFVSVPLKYLQGNGANDDDDIKSKPQGNDVFTAEEIETLTTSWGLLAVNKKQHGVNIFMKLFEMYPETKNFFSFRDIPIEELRNSKQLHAHVTTFMYGVQGFIDLLEDVDPLVESVRKLVLNHKRRGIKAKDFAAITPVLCAYLDEILGSKSTQKLKKTWGKLLDVLVDVASKAEDT